MQRFTSNPPSRQVKPTRAYIPTFYPLPCAGNRFDAPSVSRQTVAKPASTTVRTPSAPKVLMTNAQLLEGLARYLGKRPALDEAMLGRLFAKDDELLPDMRRGRVLPDRIVQRMTAFLAREVCNA